jgi:hypothetical protein
MAVNKNPGLTNIRIVLSFVHIVNVTAIFIVASCSWLNDVGPELHAERCNGKRNSVRHAKGRLCKFRIAIVKVGCCGSETYGFARRLNPSRRG